MASGVAFPLLAGVQLLAVAAALGLVAASLVPGLRSRRSTPLVAAGGVALAAAEVLTAVLFSGDSDDRLMLLRAVGYALLAGGLLARPTVGDPSPPALPAYGVVAPLGAGLPVSLLAALAAAAAAVAAVRRSRSPHDLLLAVGFGLGGAAAAIAPRAGGAAGEQGWAEGQLALRGASALVVVAALLVLARTSVLAKVAATTVAGVLVMAVTAVGVTGLVLVPTFDEQQVDALDQVGRGQFNAREALTDEALSFASQAGFCAAGSPDELERCASGLATLLSPNAGAFVAYLRPGRPPVLSAPDPALAASVLALEPTLGEGARQEGGAGVRSLQRVQRTVDGAPRDEVAAVGFSLARGQDGVVVPGLLAVYGVPLTDEYATVVKEETTYDLTLVVSGEIVASSLPTDQRDDVLRALRTAQVDADTIETQTLPAAGSRPGLQVRPLESQQALGLAVLSVDADEALEAQRATLRVLVLATLGVLLVVALAAVLLGRQVSDPVRRLTAATRRVEAGELDAVTGVRTRDEVGVLARAFESMTGSLGRLTADLRTAALQEGELRGRLETVLASMSDGLIAAGRDGLVSSANPAAAALLGLDDSATLVGRRLNEVVDLRDSGGRSLPLRVTREETVADLRRPGGPPVPVRYAVTPLVSDGGAPGLVVVLRDTTREREVERMKTEFLSNVSHELRTPLTPIHAYSDMLVRRPDLPVDKRAAFAREIHAGSTRMKRVVDLLVDAAALEAGRVSVQPRPTDVGELVDHELTLWRGRVPERAEDLRRRVGSGLPQVLVDPAWVGKALDELIDNAVKYSVAGQQVVLSATLTGEGRTVRLAVRDSGRGVPEEARAKLFASFAQVDGSATREVGGLGLGLSFVQRLADEAGLPLTWESAEGRGSVFALDLPVSAPVPPGDRSGDVDGDGTSAPPRRTVRSGSRAARPRAVARGPAR